MNVSGLLGDNVQQHVGRTVAPFPLSCLFQDHYFLFSCISHKQILLQGSTNNWNQSLQSHKGSYAMETLFTSPVKATNEPWIQFTNGGIKKSAHLMKLQTKRGNWREMMPGDKFRGTVTATSCSLCVSGAVLSRSEDDTLTERLFLKKWDQIKLIL